MPGPYPARDSDCVVGTSCLCVTSIVTLKLLDVVRES